MGRWTAVSDQDYDAEHNPRRREFRCDTCGRTQAVSYVNDKPAFVRCFYCHPERALPLRRKTA